MNRPFPAVIVVFAFGLMSAGLGPFLGCTTEQETEGQEADPARDMRLKVPAPSGDSAGTDSSVVVDVPYVSTPQKVVERMLQVADVSEDDVVYDLGSGDGRIVITAAQQFGAQGVGVEIDPELVEQARQNAKEAGVSSQVEFRHQDLFEADFRDATVVTLYLLSIVNRELRPKLFEQLDPGDRVVSHDFDMGNWEPDTTVKEGDSKLHLWTMPEAKPNSLE